MLPCESPAAPWHERYCSPPQRASRSPSRDSTLKKPPLCSGTNAAPSGVHPYGGGSYQLGLPLVEKLPVLAERLHSIVLAVGHQNPAAAVDPDAMWQHELAGSAARLAPRQRVVAVGGEAVDAAVGVTVGDEHVAGRRNRDSGPAG